MLQFTRSLFVYCIANFDLGLYYDSISLRDKPGRDGPTGFVHGYIVVSFSFITVFRRGNACSTFEDGGKISRVLIAATHRDLVGLVVPAFQKFFRMRNTHIGQIVDKRTAGALLEQRAEIIRRDAHFPRHLIQCQPRIRVMRFNICFGPLSHALVGINIFIQEITDLGDKAVQFRSISSSVVRVRILR